MYNRTLLAIYNILALMRFTLVKTCFYKSLTLFTLKFKTFWEDLNNFFLYLRLLKNWIVERFCYKWLFILFVIAFLFFLIAVF